jgi:hypothetical protein
LPAKSCLTGRSKGPPPARRLARAAASVIIRCAGQAPSRRRPLSSTLGGALEPLPSCPVLQPWVRFRSVSRTSLRGNHARPAGHCS